MPTLLTEGLSFVNGVRSNGLNSLIHASKQ